MSKTPEECPNSSQCAFFRKFAAQYFIFERFVFQNQVYFITFGQLFEILTSCCFITLKLNVTSSFPLLLFVHFTTNSYKIETNGSLISKNFNFNMTIKDFVKIYLNGELEIKEKKKQKNNKSKIKKT